MDEKQIQEAKQNYDSYITESFLKKTEFNQNIFSKFIENAIESLTVANELFTNKTSYPGLCSLNPRG